MEDVNKYQITARDLAGNTAEDTITINFKTESFAPHLTVKAGDGKAVLNWKTVDWADSYNVKRSTTSGGPYEKVESGLKVTSYTDTGLKNGTKYYYVVTGENATVEGPSSNEVAVTPKKKRSGGGHSNPPALTVSFSNSAYSVVESDEYKSIWVTLSRASESVVSVTYATYGESASESFDFIPANGTLIFEAGETELSFIVEVMDDDISEGNKTVDLELSDPTGATLGNTSTAVLTIEDNELPPTIQFDSPTYSVGESDEVEQATVTLSHASESQVSVAYSTAGGTATAGQDYTAASGTLTFEAGETSNTISVTIAGDDVDEEDETLNITLSSPSGGALGSPVTAVLTIEDDDDVVADLLANWYVRTNPIPNEDFNEVGFVNDQFMALKYQDIITSDTGETWIDPNAAGLPGAYLNGLAYDGSEYVIVGNTGGMLAYAATSEDGINWTNGSLAGVIGGAGGLFEAVYADNILVAVGSNGTILTYDGTVWTKRISGTADALSDVIYAQDIDKFVAVGAIDGDTVILTSSDGIAWSLSTLDIEGLSLACVTYGEGKLVALGDRNAQGVFITSGDGGASWSSPVDMDPTNSDEMFSAAYGGGYFVGAGEGGAIYTSPNGSSWTRRTYAGMGWTLNSVAFGNGSFVAVGQRGKIVQSGPPGGVQDSSISPVTANFDKNILEQADITITMTLNGNTLNAIRNGGDTLTADIDYTVSGSNVTIKKEYLAQQGTGQLILTFDFSSGSDSTLTITIIDTTAPVLPEDLFSAPSDIDLAAYSDPYGINAGDLDGDDDLDLVVSSKHDKGVYVFSGNDDGSFASGELYETGDTLDDSPGGIAIEDFNLDGNPDLAVGDGFLGGKIHLFYGNENGTFQDAVNYQAGWGPNALSAADLNGDDAPDLAVVNYLTHYAPDPIGDDVSVFLNFDGQGGGNVFQARADYATNEYAESITAGDLNGDGVPDLVVINNNGSDTNDITVLMNGGIGTVFTASQLIGTDNPRRAALGDFDGDNHMDLAVTNSSSDTVSILLGAGDGTFGARVDYPAGDVPVGLVTGDFNIDGYLDLVTANFLSDNVTVLLGNGDGTFDEAVHFAAGDGSFSLVARDFDSDGDLDLAVVNSNYGYESISILMNNN